MRNSTKVIANSSAMYIKMILSLFIVFYTTRLILNNLGIESFGVYNLVAGAVSLLGFVNGTMANTVQRFLAFNLGSGNDKRLNTLFNLSFNIHLVCAIVVLLALEVLGIFFFNHVFVIDIAYVGQAKVAYQMVIGITILTTITTPYVACMNAHEDIAIMAVFDFLDVILKLVCAFLLVYFPERGLVFYSIFLFVIQIINSLIRILFCHIKYSECKKIKLGNIDKTILDEFGSFIGWNMIESISWLGKNQGVPVMMNTFYGTIINAAYGIANQINGQIMFFSTSLLNALRPQVFKASGAGDKKKMMDLSYTSSRFAFFVLLSIFIPISFELPKILVLWLKQVPPYSAHFTLIIISIALVNYLSIGINIAIQAVGVVKKYQLTSALFILLSLPIGYFISSQSDNVYTLLYFMLTIEVITVIIKYVIASKILDIKIREIVKSIIVLAALVTVVALCLSYGLHLFFSMFSFSTWFLFIVTDFILVVSIIYFIGLNKQEKSIVKNLLNSLLIKIKN